MFLQKKSQNFLRANLLGRDLNDFETASGNHRGCRGGGDATTAAVVGPIRRTVTDQPQGFDRRAIPRGYDQGDAAIDAKAGKCPVPASEQFVEIECRGDALHIRQDLDIIGG
jgi:hypothetical protein